MKKITEILGYVALLMAVVLLPAMAADQPKPAVGVKQRVIFQVSDNEPAKWNLALNIVRNVQQDLGKNNVEIEFVAYGPDLAMLKLDSQVFNRIGDVLTLGVKIMACENTMANTKKTREDT